MSLLDDLRNLLARHLAHTQSQTQQGAVRWIEDHLNRLDAVVSSDIAAGEAKVHEILGELYAATNAPAAAEPTAPAEPTEPTSEPTPSAPVETVVVGEPGPELPVSAPEVPVEPAAPEETPADPAATADPVPVADDAEAAPAPAETTQS